MVPKRGAFSGEAYKLYDEYNRVHLYVEDSGFETLYCEILNRCGIQVKRVFSLSGRESVINAAAKNRSKRCVYLVDRDWSDLLPPASHKGRLIILDRHSIENYLLDYSGYRAIIQSDYPKKDASTLLSKATYKKLLREVSDKLRPLFITFVSMQLAAGQKVKNCGLSPDSFKSNSADGYVDKAKVDSFCKNQAAVIPKKIEKYFSVKELVKKGHGKYMLFFMWRYVKTEARARQRSTDSLMISMAQLSDPKVFDYIIKEIMSQCGI